MVYIFPSRSDDGAIKWEYKITFSYSAVGYATTAVGNRFIWRTNITIACPISIYILFLLIA